MGESSIEFRARGMHCHGCEHIIELSVRKLPGVRRVKADYPTERVAVTFEPASTSFDDISAAVERQGYRVVALDETDKRGLAETLLGLVVGAAGILLIIFFDTTWISDAGAPDISRRMSLDLIFLLGVLTGFHCVGMCGGLVVSYTADDARLGRRSYRSHLLYGAGKTMSYTIIGGLFGLMGAVVAFTPLLRGLAGMIAGVFLVAFGLNMLGLFAPLRRFRLGLPPSLHRFIEERTHHSHRPFVIGLANGLMIACGPLQAMYVMAAGTGSAAEGAKMLFAFGVGTLPVLLSFGVLTSLVSASLTHRLLTASGAIVVVLGAVMFNRGLILTGSGYDLQSLIAAVTSRSASPPQPIIADEPPAAPALSPPPDGPAQKEAPSPPPPRAAFQTIHMDATRAGYSPSRFVLARGVPVRWIIDGKQITSCNNRIVVPSLHLEFDVKKGRQIIEFTPETTGVIRWSCWMGMLHGAFEVVDELPEQNAEAQIATLTWPDADGAPARPRGEDVYTIVAGDTLRRIAAELYNDAERWRDILDLNPGLDPRRLRPGQTIRTHRD